MASLWWSFRGRHLPAGTGIGEWKVAIKGAFERDGFSDVRLTDLEVAGGKDGCWVSVAHFRVAEREFWEVVMAAGDQAARAVAEHTVDTIAAIRWVKRL